MKILSSIIFSLILKNYKFTSLKSFKKKYLRLLDTGYNYKEYLNSLIPAKNNTEIKINKNKKLTKSKFLKN